MSSTVIFSPGCASMVFTLNFMVSKALMTTVLAPGGAALSDERAAKALSVSVGTIEQLRRRLIEQGLEACLQRKPQDRPSVEPKFDGEKEARLITLACSKAPDGRERWSLRLLADRAVELKIVDSTSHETVRQVLSKTRSSRT